MSDLASEGGDEKIIISVQRFLLFLYEETLCLFQVIFKKYQFLAPLFLVHFGAHPFSDYFTPQKKLCKLLTYRALRIEAEGTRTLNLRIDSPIFTIFDCFHKYLPIKRLWEINLFL